MRSLNLSRETLPPMPARLLAELLRQPVLWKIFHFQDELYQNLQTNRYEKKLCTVTASCIELTISKLLLLPSFMGNEFYSLRLDK